MNKEYSKTEKPNYVLTSVIDTIWAIGTGALSGVLSG